MEQLSLDFTKPAPAPKERKAPTKPKEPKILQAGAASVGSYYQTLKGRTVRVMKKPNLVDVVLWSKATGHQVTVKCDYKLLPLWATPIKRRYDRKE